MIANNQFSQKYNLYIFFQQLLDSPPRGYKDLPTKGNKDSI